MFHCFEVRTRSRFPSVNKLALTSPDHILLLCSAGNHPSVVIVFICIPVAVMMKWYSYVEVHHVRLLVYWDDTVRDTPPSCNELSTVLCCMITGCLAWFQMACVFPPASQAFCLMIYHISCFDTVRIRCSAAAGCCRGAVFCHAVLCSPTGVQRW